MAKRDKNGNLSDFGPWYLNLDPIQNIADKTARTNNIIEESLRTHHTIKLPKIDLLNASRRNNHKLSVKMSKQSLELSPQHHTSRISPHRMAGSVLHFYKDQKKVNKAPRYESISVDLGAKEFQRKLSTIQVGEPLQKRSQIEKSHRYSLNAESAKKRCLYNLIREMNANDSVKQMFVAHKRYR